MSHVGYLRSDDVKTSARERKNQNQTYHATVEVLVHFTEGVRGDFALAGDDDANVRHRQGVLGLDGRRSAEGDEDALRGGRAVVDVGAAAVRRGLDDLAALDQTLLAFVQDPKQHDKTESKMSCCTVKNGDEIRFKGTETEM